MKKPALHYFVDRMIGLVVITVLCLVGLIFYNSYKYLVWPHVPAVVTSVKPICVFAKKSGRRSTTRKYLSCGAESEAIAAGLIADGYKLEPDKEARVTAVYEAEPGRKASATLRPWWVEVTTLHPGSMIQIRYSPFSPNEAELVTGSGKASVVILGFFLGALLLACLIAFVTYEGDGQATSS